MNKEEIICPKCYSEIKRRNIRKTTLFGNSKEYIIACRNCGFNYASDETKKYKKENKHANKK